MKINWGGGIVIAFGLFMSFVLFFVVKVQSDSKYDNDLVVDEYYKKDAVYNSEMKQIKQANDLKEKPEIVVSLEGIKIYFPSVYDIKKITGTISLYRPSNKKSDFEIPLLLSNSSLFIPKKKLLGGRWDIILNWKYEGKTYLSKEKIYIN